MPLLDQPLGRVLLVAALLAVASLALALARRRDGVLRPTRPEAAPSAVLTAADVGEALGARATLLQLSSPGCATCPQVRRVLRALAAERPGVVHVEVDAAERLDLARRLDVLRTPTVLVLGPDGELWARTSGRLDPETAARALDDALCADAVPADALPAAAVLSAAVLPDDALAHLEASRA